MSKLLQILIGTACLVIIISGCWIGYGQYAANAEAKELAAFSSQQNLKRQAHACNELMRRPNEMDNFTWDSCVSIKQKARELK